MALDTRFPASMTSYRKSDKVELDTLNPFVYCSKTRPGIGKASSAFQPPNSRQNDDCCKCRLQNDRLKKLRQQAARPAKIPF